METLATPAELQTLKLLHDQPQTLDLGLRFAEGGPFTQPIRLQVADQPMQRINIIRQGSKIEVHGPEGYAPSRCIASRSVFPESIGRSISRQQRASRSAPANASRCPRSASTAAAK